MLVCLAFQETMFLGCWYLSDYLNSLWCGVYMPLAYVHLVQLLVDSLLLCAPVALYSQVGVL